VVLSLADALRAESGRRFERARLLFWDPVKRCAMTTDDSRLASLADFLPQLMDRYSAAGLRRSAASSRAVKAVVTSIPRSLRYRLFPADNGVTLFARWAEHQGLALSPVRFTAGDCLFVPGSFWLGHYARQLAEKARAADVPVTAFVHDVLLLSNPEWLPGSHAEQFRRGCEALLPACAAIVCNSAHTREELRRLVRLPDRLPIHLCRLADRTFGRRSGPIAASVAGMLDRSYVLFVSTIIPRKNHRLLVEAWRLLRQELGERTPDLLFVGGGAPDPDLAELIARENAEGGRIVRLGNVDDRSLDALYDRAWMTAYPSLGEGYGMPVAEALSRGKICLAAPSGGIREISGALVDVIDPLAPASAVAKVKAYLDEPARHAERQAEIRRCYRPTDWADTARAIRAVLESTVARPGPSEPLS